ncbi:mechanosensitive ion channel protein 1, mitochondrial-like isoform X2 [Magnolia sinica]|uniref:mechanosensitive ion channel protein 1, mitochondrial-like isoform X2 n=1 Tax=Magnolia sinica TaxID=86752 RepID=UPI00265ACCAD|nr:mechanosensitive ion channel protein 1, mitochondrial-like isoform X2 [Magnolia sinica]
MAGVRNYILKSFFSGLSLASKTRSIQPYSSCMDFPKRPFQNLPISSGLSMSDTYRTKGRCRLGHIGHNQIRMLSLPSLVDIQHFKIDSIVPSSRSLHSSTLVKNTSRHRIALFPLCVNGMSSHRAYSSDKAEVSTTTIAGESTVDNTNVVGSDWVDSFKIAWQSAVDAATYTANKAKEASDELIPYVKQLVDSHPYLKDVIIPVGGTVSAALLAWLVMPRILRRLHKYSMQGSAALLSGNLPHEQVPYEKSFWGALEDPVRYLITFMAFSQLGVMIAPTTIASQYIPQVSRGAVILSFVWFLHRWKTNVFTRALATQNIGGLDRERLLALDKLSSVGLLVLGLMASAEASGVAVQSILTVGGIGGVATAFASRDILGNVLSGVSMQFSKPFSMGDTIKAGSIEGQVVDMGLTTTSLLNSEKFPVIVPNSLFSSQVIVNKSRAQWRAIVKKIPVLIDDLEKIPQVSEDIKCMLRSNTKVFLGKEAPYCFLSRIENSYAELTIGCNLKHMSKDELFSAEQDILLQSARIIKQHGAKLGSTYQSF